MYAATLSKYEPQRAMYELSKVVTMIVNKSSSKNEDLGKI